MLARQKRIVHGRIERCVIAAIGITVAAMLPLGPSSASAASSKHVTAPALLKDACNATLAAPAFRAQGQISQRSRAMSVDAYFGSGGALLSVTQHGDQTFNVITNGHSTYMKANQPFWQSVTKNSGAAALGADRWFDVTSDKKDFADFAKSVNKKALLSTCGKGWSIAYVGTATVNGLKAIKIHETASQESDTYYIESGATPYILRFTGSPSQKNNGDLVFSDYGVQPDTSAPPGAIPFSDFGSTGSTGSTGNTGN